MDTSHFTSSSEIKKTGRTAYYRLLDMVREGNAVRIRRGVYAREAQLADTMIDIDVVVPGGILCMLSAWNIHELTTSLPQAYHVAVKRGRNIVLPDFPRIDLHHISTEIFDIGAEERIVSGYSIKIYNRERCVCDAVKFRNKVGMDVCSEVVNNYLNLPERNLSLLMDYADKLRVKRTLERYLEIRL